MRAVSIRWKFALWSSLVTASVLVIYSFGTFLNLYDEQIEAVDLALRGEAQTLLESPVGELRGAGPLEFFRHKEWLAFAILEDDGQVLHKSPKLSSALALQALGKRRAVTLEEGPFEWRLRAFEIQDLRIVVAYDLEEVNDIIEDLLLSYLSTLPLVVAAAAGMGWWVAGRALAPVSRLTQAAESVQAGRLDTRVPEPGGNDEIHRLAVVLNDMLSRLQTSFTLAQRFAADASHELRTPLTIMHGEVGQLLHDGGLSDAQERKLVSLQEEINRLNLITTQLLLLARFDAGRVDFQCAELDFSALVAESCEDAELLGVERRIEIKSDLAPGLRVHADKLHLQRVLLNLFENAINHNVDDGKVRCRLSAAEGRVFLRIANTGPGIPADLHDKVFERFFRLDSSRSGRKGHGLGLSLCREITLAHQGTLRIEKAAAQGWTEFVLELPLLCQALP